MKKNDIFKLLVFIGVLYAIFVICIESIYNSVTIKNINDNLQERIKTTYQLNLKENEHIEYFRFNALFMNYYFVIKINDVEDINEFLSRQNVIQECRKDSYFHIYPRIRHIPIGNTLSCFYRGNNVYISIYDCTGYIGPDVKKLFFEYYEE